MRHLSRFNGSSSTQYISFPIKTPEYFSYEEQDEYQMGMRSNREFAPYQKGDLILFHDGENIRLGKVLNVFSEYREHRGVHIPKWRVQVNNKNGTWSKNWRYVYPGNIYRAYYDSNGNKKDIPEVIHKDFLME